MRTRSRHTVTILLACTVAIGACYAFRPGRSDAGQAAQTASSTEIARGRYLVAYGACNECHTPGWHESDGRIPVSQWLTGATIGFRGPWGTVYPANLRLRFQDISEQQWLFMVHTRGGHPPMTWTDLRALRDDDLRAIYRFIRSLGPAGVLAPITVPPEHQITTPYFDVMPAQAKTN